MGKKKLPALQENYNVWTTGLPLRERYSTCEINNKLSLQAFMADGCYGDEKEVDLSYDTHNIAGGFYVFVLKGSLDMRLRTLGVASPGQSNLTKTQLSLRLAAKLQMGTFADGEDWRMVTTSTGTFHWGPERPSFANGAIVLLTPRDCSILEFWCRTRAMNHNLSMRW